MSHGHTVLSHGRQRRKGQDNIKNYTRKIGRGIIWLRRGASDGLFENAVLSLGVALEFSKNPKDYRLHETFFYNKNSDCTDILSLASVLSRIIKT